MCTVFHCAVTVCVGGNVRVTGTFRIFVPLLPSVIVPLPGSSLGVFPTVYPAGRTARGSRLSNEIPYLTSTSLVDTPSAGTWTAIWVGESVVYVSALNSTPLHVKLTYDSGMKSAPEITTFCATPTGTWFGVIALIDGRALRSAM